MQLMAKVPKRYLAWILRSKKKFAFCWKRWRLAGELSDFCAKLSTFDQKGEKEKMLTFYIATTKQLQRRLPLQNSIIF